MTRAEEFACKYAGLDHPPTRRDELEEREKCDIYGACLEAYEQAEKDLALTWQDIRKITQLYNVVADEFLERYFAQLLVRDEEIYEEVLRRYNENKLIDMKASDCKCIICGKQAVAFWPCIDPDIPSHPYCRECLDKTKMKMILDMQERDSGDKKLPRPFDKVMIHTSNRHGNNRD